MLNHVIRSAVALAVVLGTLAAARTATAAGPIVEAQAVAGQPLGVGRIVLELPPDLLPEPLGVEGIGLSEKDGRILYPAVHNPAMAPIVKELLGQPSPLTSGGPVRQEVGGLLRDLMNRTPRVTIHFLYKGNGPLHVTVQARRSIPLVITPRQSPAQHRRGIETWWREYVPGPRLFQNKPDYPPLVETYLINCLARRMNLTLPQQKLAESPYAQFARELGALMGGEDVRTALLQDRVLGLAPPDPAAMEPLPEAVKLPPLEFPEPLAEAKIEPMALHVPAEFFYIRFGSFGNFLWFQDTMDTWGGDLQNLVAQRGLNDGRDARIEQRLILKQSQLSRMLGGTVISDVAMVGTDLLFEDGPAFGFLFEARNNMLLSADMTGGRSDRVKAGGVTEETLKIEGREVSYIWSADGAVRSYYAAVDGYHFVTTSRALMRRFLQVQAAKGEGALGVTQEFRHHRNILPLSREDAVFIYLSDAFFRNVTSPQYRIEMMRRLEAATDIDAVRLAKLCAATEGRKGQSIDDLVAGGLLPAGFGPRPDGSQAVIDGGEVRDQMRGRRGAFIPVPDVPINQVSPIEAQSYRKFLDAYAEQWGRLEPIAVGIQRKGLSGKREQVTLDVRMTPLQRKRIDMLQKVAGQVDKVRLAPVEGNLASFEAVLRGQRMFGGLQDVLPPDMAGGRFMPWQMLRNMVIGYLGNLGDRGVLGLLDVTFLRAPDPSGLSRNVLGLYRLERGQYAFYSFQMEVLAKVVPQVRFVEALRPAQLRLSIGDPSAARIAPLVNSLGYSRSRETALGNVRLMHALDQQLHIPPKGCREAAEYLLDAKLVCPLGGQYVLREVKGGVPRWTTTVLEKSPAPAGMISQAPAGMVAPPMNWFRGLELDASLVGSVLSAHAEVIMQLPKEKK